MTDKTLGQVCKEAWFAYEPDFMSERWEAAAGRTRVIGQVRRINLSAVYQVMPAGVAAAGAHHQQFFQFRKRHRIMLRPVSKDAVRNFGAHEKAT